MNNESLSDSDLKTEETVDSEQTAKEDNPGTHDEGLSRGDTEDFKWYVAHVLSGYENRVTKTLKERIINHKLTEYFSQILVPEETVVANVNGKKRSMKKKFFPGYLLIKMVMNDKSWHLVKNTDKITGFVSGNKTKPLPISDSEAEFMINQNKGSAVGKSRSSIDFSEGDSVKVIEGPFTSFIGTVEAVSDKGKIKVNVSIFGRPTPVELDFSQVEKA